VLLDAYDERRTQKAKRQMAVTLFDDESEGNDGGARWEPLA
jgi:hypothetical protein